MGKKLVLESTAPFQGLPELVAHQEGLFAAEGLDVEFVPRGQSAPKATDTSITDPNELSASLSHASTLESGGASLYNACEWGNYRRVQDSQAGARQVGRRAIIVYGALMVPPWSDVYTPQQLAGKMIGLPYFAGNHFLTLQALEGFLPREAITTCLAPNGSINRFRSLMNREMDATSLTEPHISLAEKAGCRTIVLAPFHGTEVASPDFDAETYAAFNRAVREAVRRINVDKRKYAQYFLDYHSSESEIAALTVDDLDLSRIQVTVPTPIPADEMARTARWMVTWDLLDADTRPEDLVDAEIQRRGHEVAAG